MSYTLTLLLLVPISIKVAMHAVRSGSPCITTTKPVHGGVDDDDPNTEPQEDQEDL